MKEGARALKKLTEKRVLYLPYRMVMKQKYYKKKEDLPVELVKNLKETCQCRVRLKHANVLTCIYYYEIVNELLRRRKKQRDQIYSDQSNHTDSSGSN